MLYDLQLIKELCDELGLIAIPSDTRLEIQLGERAILFFENFEDEQDGIMAFEGTPWHTHGDIMFADSCGLYIEWNCLDVVAGLKDGSVLVCELWRNGDLQDRWLIHREFNDEVQHLMAGDEIRILTPLPA